MRTGASQLGIILTQLFGCRFDDEPWAQMRCLGGDADRAVVGVA